MKANIDYLWRLKRKMKGKDIDIKLHMLEDERGKINTACTPQSLSSCIGIGQPASHRYAWTHVQVWYLRESDVFWKHSCWRTPT